VPVRPALVRAALAGLTLSAVLSGCAGTDPAATASTGSSAESSARASTGAPASTDAGQRIEVAFAGGQVSGDSGRVPVPVGTPVTLAITSDVADEVHVHGYDLEAELTPGTPAQLTFEATIPGVFEVELHEAGTVLLSLQVE
jgi:hypothetical protein